MVEIVHCDRRGLRGDAVRSSCDEVAVLAHATVDQRIDRGIDIADHSQVRVTIAVDVAGCDRGGRCSHGIGLRTGESAGFGVVEEDRCIGAVVIAERNFGAATAIEVGNGNSRVIGGFGHGVPRTQGREVGGCAAGAVESRHRVGVDGSEALVAASIEVAGSHRDGSRHIEKLAERHIARGIAGGQQHQDIAIGGRDHQVGATVAVEIRCRHRH